MTEPRRSTPIPENRSRKSRTTTPAPRADGERVADDRSEDLRLIERLVRQDASAWKQFVLKYQRLVFARVGRTLKQFGREDDHSLTEDICADTFAMLLTDGCAQLRRFEGRSKLSTWLDVVARRVCLRKLSQAQNRMTRTVAPRDLETMTGSSGNDAVLTEDRHELLLAMEHLLEADRQVLRMFYFDQRSYAQIATELDLSINTVGPKLQRAQQRLRKILVTNQERTNTE